MRRSFLAQIKADPDAKTDENSGRAGGGGFGTLVASPFKVPTSTSSTRSRQVGGTRSGDSKRSRVVFTENDFYTNTEPDEPAAKKKKGKGKKADDSDDDDGPKKGKGGFVDKYVAPPPPRQFPIYRPKSIDAVSKPFTIPGLKKRGVILDVKPSQRVLGTRQPGEIIPAPLHDPLANQAIVLWDPTVDDREAERELERLRAERAAREAEEEEGATKLELERKKVHKSLADILGIADREKKKAMVKKVAVVIDPVLGVKLRPHQVEGVKFLYRCASGMTDENAYGCIMADEMGLGKTLQCIALMWTLLRQSPLPNKHAIDKAIVVCPSSLVKNWANELTKWLGEGVVNPMAIDGKIVGNELVNNVRQWCSTKGKQVTQPIIIVSYEKLRTLSEELGTTEVGLLLADEGHRLKNSTNQTYTALNSINCKRRVILTGTPIQNDLDEYFSLLNFCNPGYLGTKVEFHKAYELPIIKGRDGLASDKEKEKGDAAMKELLTKVNKFIIRRTNDLLSKYLPVKYEHVVFIGLSPFQLALYRFFMKTPTLQALLKGKESQPLKAITILRKLCNHPDLLKFDEDMPGAEETFPEEYDIRDKRRKLDPVYSGKMAVLARFLSQMRANSPTDKIVLISNFTTTLDQFEKLCSANKYGFLRLDGTMNVTKRQKLVDKFNNPEGKEFVFLLSSKAGGCGINLIGANRLILFDPDWNPASDMQALARVWRDGQKKDCFVYRFVTTGTVEEKIFQRQSHKQNLSSCIVDAHEDIERHYSGDNLRQLFTYVEKDCETHDLFKCKRCKNGKQTIKSPAMLYGDTSTWNHLTNSCLATIHDDLLRAETGLDAVTACFQRLDVGASLFL